MPTTIERANAPWLMSEARQRRLFAAWSRMATESKPQVSLEADGPAVQKTGYSVHNGVAQIQVRGVLMKYGTGYDLWDELLGVCSTQRLMPTVTAAFADSAVRGVSLIIDSPGGEAAGTTELADLIYRSSQASGKPTQARVSDLAASGGYWIAAHCDSISCNPDGEVGSIGVYCLLADDSEFWKSLGVDWQVVSSGGVKGLGADGKVDDVLREDVRRGVVSIYDRFVEVVARGRGMTDEQARSLADGRCWIAAEALEHRLIDNIAPADVALAAFDKDINMTSEQFRAYAAENPNELKAVAEPLVTKAVGETEERVKAESQPQPATISDLRTAFPDDSEFVLAQLEQKSTMAGAKAAFGDRAVTQLQDVKGKLDTATAKLAERDPGSAGRSAPVQTAAPDAGETNDENKPVSEDRRNELLAMAGMSKR